MDPLCKPQQPQLLDYMRNYLNEFADEAANACSAAHLISPDTMCATPKDVATLKEHLHDGKLTQTDLQKFNLFALHHSLLSAMNVEVCTQATEAGMHTCNVTQTKAHLDMDRSIRVIAGGVTLECPANGSPKTAPAKTPGLITL